MVRQELYTLSLHHNAFGSGEREELQLGSRSPEDAAQWRAALLRARDRADAPAKPQPEAAPALAAQGCESAPASEGGAHAGGDTPFPSTASKPRASERRAIGHVPPVLRDVQEVARRGPVALPRSNSVTQRGVGLFGEEAVGHAAEEGPSVVPPEGGGTTWRLCALENGLRFFEDGSGTASAGWGAAPCTKVAGRVRAPSDAIFRLVMDLGASRGEWDCTFSGGRVLEQLDGHTEVIHILLRCMRLCSPALPSRPRDLVMTRYWRREEDGTYVILFRSTEHPACPPLPGTVRADVACGCYIISPLGASDSLLMYLLETSPAGWMLPCTGMPRAFQRALLMPVAGVRDFFEQQSEKSAASFETGLANPLGDLLAGSDEEEEEEPTQGEPAAVARPRSSLEEAIPPATPSAEPCAQQCAAATTPLPALAQPQGPSPSTLRRNSSSSLGGAAALAPASVTSYEAPHDFRGLPSDPASGASVPFGLWPPPKGQRGINTWCNPAGNRFMVRSPTYLSNGVKTCAGVPLMKLVAVDWLHAEERIDNICSRPQGVAQRALLPSGEQDLHLFCVNLQVPGAKPYSIIFYFAQRGPVPPDSCLGRFWHGDDAYRAPRFKLIPSITEGAWVVQRSVGTKPLIVGNALRTSYHGGGDARFLEVDVDIGSSSVANSVVRFVLVYLKTLVIDLGFLIESKTEAELPEQLIGAMRVAHLDPDLAHEAPSVA